MPEVLKTKVVVDAETKGVTQAAAAVDKLTDELLQLATAQEQAASASQKIAEAIRRVDASGDTAGEEMRVLNGDLDRVAATMQKTTQEAKEYAVQLAGMESATSEQVQEASKLSAITRDFADSQSQLNRELHEGTQKSEASADAIKQHAVAEERLTLSLEEGYVAQKSITDANQQYETGLKRLVLEQEENHVAIKSTTDATIRHATALKQMDLEQDKAFVSTKALGQATQRLATEEKQLEIGVSEAAIAMKAQQSETLRLAQAEVRAKNETRMFGVEVGKLKESLITAVAAGGVAGLVFKGMSIIGDAFRRGAEAAKEFQRQATETFSSLEEEVARTKAQVPELINSHEELYESTVRAARALGRGTLETQTAIRKAMNLGLEYDEAMKAVAVSTDAARVANADMTDTLVSGMSTVNAYGTGVYDINEVLDQYAYLVQNSNLETQDLISGMAKIISPAAEAGVSLEEVAAAMIVMNRQGDDFKEIGDLLGNMLTQIAVRGTQLSNAFVDAAGMGFREFTAAGGTLVEGLILIEEHAEATGQSVSELAQGNSKFYRDMLAGRGILELTGRHTSELAEAYEGANVAVGTLDAQVAEFEGTLYLATEEMNSAKDAAYAVEGSLTKGLAMGFTNAKTSLYDLINGISSGIASYRELNAAIGESALTGTQGVEIDSYLTSLVDVGGTEIEIAGEINDLRREAARLLLVNLDISQEQLELELFLYHFQKNALAGKKEELSIYQSISDIDRLKDFDRMTEAQKEAYELQLKQAEEAERKEKAEQSALAVAEQRAYWEGVIAERLAEQNAKLVEAYETSQSYIDNISGLQVELGIATDPEEIEELRRQLEEAGDAIDTHYKKALIDGMIASMGFEESTIDLAVRLGLLTEEAGELQKEFIGISIEIGKLAESKGFADLGLEAQAIAAQGVADGLWSADEAIAHFDPSNWAEGVTPGIARAEQGFMDPIIQVRIPEEDEAKLTALEEQLVLITTSEWEAWVNANVGQAIIDVDDFGTHTDIAARDRYMTIYVDYQVRGSSGDSPGGGDSEFATGGSMVVPAGYNNDDYLIGVSSGEYVNVTPSGQAPSGAGGINIEVINQFATGVHNPSQVAAGASDGLYSALEKAGLI